MSLFRLSSRKVGQKVLPKARLASSTSTLPEDEYTTAPQYPPIQDLCHRARLERKKLAVHEEIRNVKTVEEKQIKLNMPKYYGFQCILLNEGEVPYNGLNFAQQATKTHLIRQNALPEFYNNINVDEAAKDLKENIEEAILIELDLLLRRFDINNETLTEKQKTDLISSSLTKQINRIITKRLSQNYKHLLDATLDWDPRIEATWYAGGINTPEKLRKFYKSLPWMEEFVNDPVDKLMFYSGSPSLTLRSDVPLKPIISYSEADNPDFLVPHFGYDPRTIGLFKDYKHMANIPGFWPGSRDTFGILSYHQQGYLQEHLNDFNDGNDNKEALLYHGIISSYAWLHAQANYLGFTTFNDITYPLVTQTVITDGKFWSFLIYQLNTMLFCGNNYKDNPKKNVCWATDQFKLFEEIKEGKIIGFNEDVLKTLVKFYANVPEERLGINMRPYLSSDEKIIADYDDPEKRQWLEDHYKFLTSNRPRLKDIDEVYLWEKIYKIDHKTRFMEKRLRFFELFKKPERRRLNDRLPRYIPRAHRPHLKRYQGRYAKDFWP